MRALVVLTCLLTACSIAPAPDADSRTTVAPTVPATTTTVPATTTTAPADTVPVATLPASEPLVAATSSGVMVAIRAEGGGRAIVGTPCNASAVVPIEELTRVGPVDVVIDPGHGGNIETGAVGANGLREADLNLDVALLLEAELAERGISSVLTRYADYRMAIAARVELTAAASPQLFVSVHHNAGDISPSDVPGTVVFHQVDDEESARAGAILYEELVSAFEPLDVPWVASNPPGAVAAVRGSDGLDAYGVLRRNYPVPAVLTEALFLQNPAEADLLATGEIQQLEALALADGIQRFLETEDAGSGRYGPLVYNFPVSSTGGTDGCVDPELEG